MIGYSGFHRGRHAQRAMHAAEVVIGEVQAVRAAKTSESVPMFSEALDA
jgi:hypothetical protein